MSNGKDKVKAQDPEKTVIKALGLLAHLVGGGTCAVDVKDDKIVRVRPLHYDWKYDKRQFNPWKIQKNGKTLELVAKSLPGPFSLAYKKRAYSPNRIKYPLKRVDWDPNGERNPQNRGKSKYKRISWDEAAEIVASEIKRVHKKYGPLAILAQGDGHGENKTLHAPHGQQTFLLDKMGGFTQQVRNPDSWEGWYWGAKHVWGDGWAGLMSPVDNIVKDMIENCQMILCWGFDPQATPWPSSQFLSLLCYFWSEVGIKQVYVCPDLNYGAALHADKWIPVLPSTDAALQLAIAYVWMTEGTYDKDYVATHTVGYDKFEDYVLGREDGIAKTPEWASSKCGIPEWTIKALAREFAAKKTSIAHSLGGGMIRGAYSHEPARLEVLLLGMQGLGKPGVHQAAILRRGMPRSQGGESTSSTSTELFKGKLTSMEIFLKISFSGRLTRIAQTSMVPWAKQVIPKPLIHKAIPSDEPLSWHGSGAILAPVEDQFVKYTYPLPTEEGGTEIHMIWSDTPCRITCWCGGNETMAALRNPKIECIVIQHPWLENECLFADIILPSLTTFEVEDIVADLSKGEQFKSIQFQRQAIKPIGESKSDFEIVCEIAKKLDMYEEYTEGKTNEELMKSYFDFVGAQNFLTWEELKEKEYFVFPTAPDWEKDPAGFLKFYQDPAANPLPTPSGKLEFYSERLAKHFPNDNERPPTPKWIEKGVDHDERLSSERAKKYPLLQISNHPRWRFHAQCDDISWIRESPTCKVKGPDGYLYEPLWINPIDAEKRGIKNGDIVKVYNERGTVLGGAYVAERVRPGVVSMYDGSRVDSIVPGDLDRGGAINTIAPDKINSKNCVGMVVNGYLVEVERVTMAQMEEWKKQYPEAFEREYDPASGLCFNAWVEGGME